MSLQTDLKNLANKEKAVLLSRYFKIGKGEYAEGDIFLGVMVPQQRIIAKKYRELSLAGISELLKSGIHEYRLTSLFILCDQFKKNPDKKYVDFYLKNTRYINNWDLVDLSSHKILGTYLIDKPKDMLYTLAVSKNLWEKRISIISTFAFIKHNDYKDALAIAEILLHDSHDLIHKAVGWALREIGNKDSKVEEAFLQKHYKTMPRTMLRYALEKFPPKKRMFYLKRKM